MHVPVRALLLTVPLVVAPAAGAETWQPTHDLELVGDAQPGDVLGWSAALAGGKAYVAAAPDMATLNGPPGALHVFDLSTGLQVDKRRPAGVVSNNYFGTETTAFGSGVIVGASGTNGDRGSAFVYGAAGAGATPVQLQAPDGQSGDHFGLALAMNGQRILVGAALDDEPGITEAGSVHVYDAATGAHVRKIVAPDPREQARFGRRLALSGNTALIGASQDSETGGFAAGAAYLYNLETSQSVKLRSTSPSALDQFGWGLDVNEKFAVVGALFDEVGGVSSGVTYVFDTATGALLHTLAPDGAVAGMQFGYSVAVSGNFALIGAPGTSNNAGAAYVFDLTTGEEVAKLGAPTTVTNDLFGRDVSLDGTTALVTAVDREVNGVRSGAAYVFTVPEPATAAIAAIALPILSRRRTRRGRTS